MRPNITNRILDALVVIFIILALISLALNLIAFFLIFLPRDATRNARETAKALINLIWIGDSRLWATLYESLHMKGNGI